MIRDIRTAEELARLIERGRGYLYNDFGGRNPRFCPIHHVRCRSVPRMLQPSHDRLTVPKIWSEELHQLVTEVRARGKIYAFCQNEPELAESNGPSVPFPMQISLRKVRQTSGQATTESFFSAPNIGFQVTRQRGGVTIVSAYRLQYQKPKTRALQEAIAGAVADLVVGPGQMLEAVYYSSATDRVDAENVLLYIVGTGRFAAAARNGLRFERVFSAFPGEATGTHCHRYSLVPAASDSSHWSRVRPILEVPSMPITNLDALKRPESIWLEARREIPSGAVPHLGRFALELELELGLGDRIRPADVLKPLIDGLIAGLHSHDGTSSDIVVPRLAARLGLPVGQVQAYLGDDTRAWLGRRRLLWPWGTGVQWNPADDACVSAVLRLRDSRTSDWRLSFGLYEVESRA